MATIKGINQTLIDAGGIAGLTGGLRDGRVKVCLDYVDLAATQTGATDVLRLFGTLPAGARILQLKFVTSGNQTSTVAVGDLASATRYIAAGQTTLQTAGAIMSCPGYQYTVGTATNDNQIIVTFATAVGAAGYLYAEVYYTTD
jgi:hypothetical protein